MLPKGKKSPIDAYTTRHECYAVSLRRVRKNGLKKFSVRSERLVVLKNFIIGSGIEWIRLLPWRWQFTTLFGSVFDSSRLHLMEKVLAMTIENISIQMKNINHRPDEQPVKWQMIPLSKKNIQKKFRKLLFCHDFFNSLLTFYDNPWPPSPVQALQFSALLPSAHLS